MADININSSINVKGRLTFSRKLNETQDGFVISGILATHPYIESLDRLETARYILDGIEVYEEAYGSDDYNIIYYFTASNLEIKGYDYECARLLLYPQEMQDIENIMYKDEHPILGNIGPEYKDIIKDDTEEGDEKDNG